MESPLLYTAFKLELNKTSPEQKESYFLFGIQCINYRVIFYASYHDLQIHCHLVTQVLNKFGEWGDFKWMQWKKKVCPEKREDDQCLKKNVVLHCWNQTHKMGVPQARTTTELEPRTQFLKFKRSQI